MSPRQPIYSEESEAGSGWAAGAQTADHDDASQTAGPRRTGRDHQRSRPSKDPRIPEDQGGGRFEQERTVHDDRLALCPALFPQARGVAFGRW